MVGGASRRDARVQLCEDGKKAMGERGDWKEMLGGMTGRGGRSRSVVEMRDARRV